MHGLGGCHIETFKEWRKRMKIECPFCSQGYNLPDDRLPAGKKISFPCKACNNKISIDLRSETAQDQSSESKGAGSSPPSVDGEKLKAKILRSLKDLPPMPQVLIKAQKIMGDKNSGIQELAEVLETDQAIATKVLRMANSPYYGLSGKVSSIQHASVVLGQKTLGELITVAGSSNLIGNALEGYQLEAGALWKHSMAVAFGCRMISQKKAPDLADDAFSAGLIHDSGKLILNAHVLELKDAFDSKMNNGHQTFLDAEKDILGFDHAEIASEACKKWNIPETLAVAIRYHHHPHLSQDDKLTQILHIADSIALMSGIGTGYDGMLYKMDDKSMDIIGLQAEDFGLVMEEVSEYVAKMEQQV